MVPYLLIPPMEEPGHLVWLAMFVHLLHLGPQLANNNTTHLHDIQNTWSLMCLLAVTDTLGL